MAGQGVPAGQHVLHDAAGGEELARQAVRADLVVAGREVVALEAELAHPDLSVGVVAAVGVEHPAAALAQNGLVGQQRQVGDRPQGSAHDTKGNH